MEGVLEKTADNVYLKPMIIQNLASAEKLNDQAIKLVIEFLGEDNLPRLEDGKINGAPCALQTEREISIYLNNTGRLLELLLDRLGE